MSKDDKISLMWSCNDSSSLCAIPINFCFNVPKIPKSGSDTLGEKAGCFKVRKSELAKNDLALFQV